MIRHGQTTCNQAAVIQGPRVDSHLSDEGHAQVRRLGQAFSETPIDALYVSPMVRARQTADAVVASRPDDLVAQVVPEYYEMDFGTLCGRNLGEVQDTLNEVIDAWNLGFVQTPFPGGESPVVAQHRVRPFVRRVAAEARDKDVAVVGPGRVNRILVATLTNTPLSELDRFPQDNANITHLDLHDDQLVVRRLNDTRHLDGPT